MKLPKNRFLSKNSLIIIAILLLGLFLRLYRLSYNFGFNADQEWLATRARDLLSGDIVLLGPVTSIGNYSIGPGYIYLWAIFSYFLSGAPIAGAYLSVVLGLAFIVLMFVFLKNNLNEQIAYLISFILAISTNFITWDQNSWAPSLFYVSQMILLYGAYIVNKNKLGYLLMAIGLVLGFQSHVGIFLSLLPILIYLFFVKPIKIDKRYLILVVCVLFFAFSPNLIFDLSHNFVNGKKIIDIVKGDGINYTVGFGKIINVLAINTVSLIYPRNVNNLDSLIIKTFFALILVNAISLLRNKKIKNISLLSLITLIIPSSFFYFTQTKFSEYYLLMTVPSSVILTSLFLYSLSKNKVYLIYLIMAISLFLNFTQYKIKNQTSAHTYLQPKLDTIAKIIEIGGKEGYGVSVTTDLGQGFGFKYLFDYFGITANVPPKINETKIFSIIIPEGYEGMYGMEDFNGIGLRWQGI